MDWKRTAPLSSDFWIPRRFHRGWSHRRHARCQWPKHRSRHPTSGSQSFYHPLMELMGQMKWILTVALQCQISMKSSGSGSQVLARIIWSIHFLDTKSNHPYPALHYCYVNEHFPRRPSCDYHEFTINFR
jgi:hypothetical protein